MDVCSLGVESKFVLSADVVNLFFCYVFSQRSCFIECILSSAKCTELPRHAGTQGFNRISGLRSNAKNACSLHKLQHAISAEESRGPWVSCASHGADHACEGYAVKLSRL